MFKTKSQEDVEMAEEITIELSRRFLDTINIRQILVFHKLTGTTLVSHNFSEQVTDPDLISGFITAISAFEKELVGLAGGLEELKYKFIRILVDIGELVSAALIVNGDYYPSDSLRRNFQEFRERFELEFQTDLESFDGYVKPYRNISHLLEDHFEISIFNPHKLLPKKYFSNLKKLFELPKEQIQVIRNTSVKELEKKLDNFLKY